MKNKKLLYVLIPLTVLVWGLIAVRILVHFRPERNKDIYSGNKLNGQTENHLSDTFSISADYPDPFLGRTLSMEESQQNLTTYQIKKLTTESNEPTVQWPEIHYGGAIKNKNSNRELYLVKIGTADYLMKPGDITGQIALFKAFKDSIVVLCRLEKKTIYKDKQ